MAVMASTTHRDLTAWREAMNLVEIVYRATAGFPKSEVFGLTSQIRRSAVSVPSNIAEGAARNTPRELIHFLGISCGSLAELETQLELAIRLEFLEADAEAMRQTNRVGRIVRSLRNSLRGRRRDEVEKE
jgi:four helix bundle protein